LFVGSFKVEVLCSQQGQLILA